MAIFVTDAVFLFLSMKDYKDSMSSSAQNVLFGKIFLCFYLIGMGVLAILLTILFRIVKKREYLYGLILISLLSIFYSIDYMLFVDRVTAWSTYSLKETWITIFWDSYRYFPMLMLIYVLLTNKLIKGITPKKSQSVLEQRRNLLCLRKYQLLTINH